MRCTAITRAVVMTVSSVSRQPYVHPPIIRGKQNKPVEFGARLSVSLTGEGLAHVDALRWDALLMKAVL